MQEYSSIKALFLSFFSRDVYRDVFLRWQGIGFGYLLLLNIVLITPLIVVLMIQADRAIFTDGTLRPELRDIAGQAIAQLPPLQWENGELSTPAEQPHRIEVSIEGEPVLLAIIDLDASLADLRDSDAIMLLTREAVHAREGEHEFKTHYWSEIGGEAGQESFYLDSDRAGHFFNRAVAWTVDNKLWLYVTFGLIGWSGTLLVMFLYRAVQVLILGGAGLLIASVMKLHLRYEDAVRLSCVALTPAVLADMVLTLAIGDGISIPLFIILTLFYLGFAIHSNRTLETGDDRRP